MTYTQLSSETRSGTEKNNYGLAQNQNGWWYLKDGKVDFDFTGLAKNNNGIWYVKDGKVDFDYSGNASCKISKGKLVI